jgi:hypothetical protein
MILPAHGGKGQLMVPEGRFMAENDKSCEVVGWQANFFAQSSVLSTHYLSIDPER